MSGHAGQGQEQVFQNQGVNPVAGAGGNSNHGYTGVVGASPDPLMLTAPPPSGVTRHNQAEPCMYTALARLQLLQQQSLVHQSTTAAPVPPGTTLTNPQPAFRKPQGKPQSDASANTSTAIREKKQSGDGESELCKKIRAELAKTTLARACAPVSSNQQHYAVLRHNSAVLRHNSAVLRHNSAVLRNNSAAQEKLSKNTIQVQTRDFATASPRPALNPTTHTDHDELMLLKQLLRKHQHKVAQRASTTNHGASQTPQCQQPNNSEANSSATSQPPHAQSQALKSYTEVVMDLQREWERLKRRQLQLERERANRPWNPSFFSELVLGTNIDGDGSKKSQSPQPDKASQDSDPKMSDKASQDGDT